MTYKLDTLIGVITNEKKNSFWGFKDPLFGKSWGDIKLINGWWFTMNDLWTYTFGCHLGHALEFLFAVGELARSWECISTIL